MKETMAWLRGINPNVAAITLAAFTFAASLLGFGLMVRAEISALRVEIKADNATFRAEMRADFAALRADFAALREDNAAFKAEIREENAAFKAEVRADIAKMRADLEDIADALDTRLSAIELEQARMRGVISVLQDAVGVLPP